MSSINAFDVNVYSEEKHSVTESEYDEVMKLMVECGMVCHFCNQAIEQHDAINWHHPLFKSQGGVETVAAHTRCHVEWHSRNGHFKQWGRQGGLKSAETGRWAFNLKHVRSHPAYQPIRDRYNWQFVGWTAGLVM